MHVAGQLVDYVLMLSVYGRPHYQNMTPSTSVEPQFQLQKLGYGRPHQLAVFDSKVAFFFLLFFPLPLSWISFLVTRQLAGPYSSPQAQVPRPA